MADAEVQVPNVSNIEQTINNIPSTSQGQVRLEERYLKDQDKLLSAYILAKPYL